MFPPVAPPNAGVEENKLGVVPGWLSRGCVWAVVEVGAGASEPFLLISLAVAEKMLLDPEVGWLGPGAAEKREGGWEEVAEEAEGAPNKGVAAGAVTVGAAAAADDALEVPKIEVPGVVAGACAPKVPDAGLAKREPEVSAADADVEVPNAADGLGENRLPLAAG